ncbi:MAG TPA: sigma-70 family RNA polymerase sigma factor [Moorella mulderi]|nr:sigma-70 family RNA polymerase sigma factor [Moorella mulderi]
MHIEIRRAEKLSFRERQVVVLKEMGLSNEEVARRLNINGSTVATLFHRARGKGYQVVIVLPGDILGLGEEERDGEQTE